VPGIFGLYQALEALKILTGFVAPLRGEILQYDFATLQQTRLKVPRDPACNHCPDISTADTCYHGSLADAAAQQLRIIDIRSPAESAIRPLAVARDTIPMPDLLATPTRYLHPSEAVLLVCASGQRAQATAEALHRLGYYAVLAYPGAW
jgi:thiazole biosynthesis adenylyltransferase thiF